MCLFPFSKAFEIINEFLHIFANLSNHITIHVAEDTHVANTEMHMWDFIVIMHMAENKC